MLSDAALDETTPVKRVSNSLTGRPWQAAESTLLGNAGACDEHEDSSSVVNRELCYIKGDPATGTH